MIYLNRNKQKQLKPLLLVLFLTFVLHTSYVQSLEILSTDNNGQITNANSVNPYISGNGKFVVFESSNLLPNSGVGNQIFLRDLTTGQLELISVNDIGNGGNAESFLPFGSSAKAITDDGRFVVFKTTATDIVAGSNPNGLNMIYLRDRENNTTELISKNSMGDSANGNSLYFTIAPESPKATVGFNSLATNLDALDTLSDSDTFIHETLVGTTKLACFNLAGETIFNGCQEFSLACSGAAIAFSSVDGNIVPNDADLNKDIFVGLPFFGDSHILLTQNELGVSANTGTHTPPSISCDGRFVTFATMFSLINVMTDPSDTPDTYFIDILTDTKFRLKDSLGVPVGYSFPTISSQNNLITLETSQSLDPIDTQFPDIYLTQITGMFSNSDPILISQNNNTASNNSSTSSATLSNYGRVVFQSSASNLSPIPDNNFVSDIFASDKSEIIFKNGFETP